MELARITRPSASAGELRAARVIASWLRRFGCSVTVEAEPAHGGYWWPLGVANAVSAAGAALVLGRSTRWRRAASATVAATAAEALWDDLGHGRRWFRRLLFPKRTTCNVLGATGDPTADRLLVLIAHHDAAHSGLVFHPRLAQLGPRLAPRLHERASHTLPLLYAVWLGPIAVCLGSLGNSRRLLRSGVLLSLAAVAAMADVGMRPVVAGANDNLSAVATLIALAEGLQHRPISGLRVWLLSTGSEESFSEGMHAFGRRHFGELARSTTEFLCLECLGSKTLAVLEGEGMLHMRDYPPHMREALARAAAAAGVTIARGARTAAATDALIALRAGFPVVTLASLEQTKLPSNYHWPSDTPDGLCWQTIEDAITTCESFIRMRAAQLPPRRSWNGTPTRSC